MAGTPPSPIIFPLLQIVFTLLPRMPGFPVQFGARKKLSKYFYLCKSLLNYAQPKTITTLHFAIDSRKGILLTPHDLNPRREDVTFSLKLEQK